MFNQSTELPKEAAQPELLDQIYSLRNELTRFHDTNSSLYRIAGTLKSFPPQKGETCGDANVAEPQTLTGLLYEIINSFKYANDYHESIKDHLRTVIGADLNY